MGLIKLVLEDIVFGAMILAILSLVIYCFIKKKKGEVFDDYDKEDEEIIMNHSEADHRGRGWFDKDKFARNYLGMAISGGDINYNSNQ